MQTNDGQELERILETSRLALLAATASLSAEEAQAKTADSWSVVEIIEHLGLVERLFSGRIANTDRSGELSINPEREAAITEDVPNRGTRINAPEITKPQGRFPSVGQALAEFDDVRLYVGEVLQAKEQDLRYMQVKHPFAGLLSGYEAFLLIAAHAHRHVAQIREMQDKTAA